MSIQAARFFAVEMVRKAACDVLPQLTLQEQDRRDAEVLFSCGVDPTSRHYSILASLASMRRERFANLDNDYHRLLNASSAVLQHVDVFLTWAAEAEDAETQAERLKQVYAMLPGSLDCRSLFSLNLLSPSLARRNQQKILADISGVHVAIQTQRARLDDLFSKVGEPSQTTLNQLEESFDELLRKTSEIEERINAGAEDQQAASIGEEVAKPNGDREDHSEISARSPEEHDLTDPTSLGDESAERVEPPIDSYGESEPAPITTEQVVKQVVDPEPYREIYEAIYQPLKKEWIEEKSFEEFKENIVAEYQELEYYSHMSSEELGKTFLARAQSPRGGEWRHLLCEEGSSLRVSIDTDTPPSYVVCLGQIDKDLVEVAKESGKFFLKRFDNCVFKHVPGHPEYELDVSSSEMDGKLFYLFCNNNPIQQGGRPASVIQVEFFAVYSSSAS